MTVRGGSAGGWAEGGSGVRNSSLERADHPVVLPRLSDKFEVTGLHAEGAVCEVFKAHHVALDIAVAVKVLRPALAADPRFLERMRVEAQVLPRLRSRHIVQCFDRGIAEDGRPYTVLEFLRGETLEAVLARLGKLDELTTIEIGLELLDALATAHSRGIVHRDVSLRNLIVHHTEHDPATLKLIDFGFAWILPGAPESAPEPPALLERDAAIGTPRFASPEVALGRSDLDGRADLYSAGAILYTLLAGRDPFAELRTPDAVIEAQAYRAVPPLSVHVRNVSKPLEQVVMRLLRKNRVERFANAAEAQQALAAVREATQAEAHKAASIPPQTSPPSLAPGTHCGHFLVKRLVGADGTAELYEGETETPLKRRVSLKLAKLERPLGALERDRFYEGARLLATIRHPNLPTVHQAGELDGRPWLAMDFVEGVPLRRMLESKRRLDLPSVIKLAYGIARALRQLERLGLARERLTPDDVIVTPGGEASVKHDLPGLESPSPGAASKVQAWAGIVSELLAGPSERTAERARSGALSLEALLGQRSFPPPKPSERELPPPLRRVLDAANDPDLAERPTNFDDVCHALDEASENLPLARPLATAPEFSLVSSGDFLVFAWRTPSASAVRDARAHARSTSFQTALVVVEAGSLHPDTATQEELHHLTRDLESLASVVAIVHEDSGLGGANLRSELTTAGYVLPNCTRSSVFTSRETAVEWLSRHHSALVGISYLSGVLAGLCSSNEDASAHPASAIRNVHYVQPCSEPGPLPLVRAQDENHFIATWDNAFIQIWRGQVSAETLALASESADEFVQKNENNPVVGITIIEAASPAPKDELREQCSAYYRDLALRMNEHIVVVEGGGLRMALVRSVALAFSIMTPRRFPYRFVQTVEASAPLVGPHLSPHAGGPAGYVSAVRLLRQGRIS